MRKGLFLSLITAIALQSATLNEVLEDVMQTSPQILEKQKEYNAAVNDLQSAKGMYFPKLVFTGDVGYKRAKNSTNGYEYSNNSFYSAKLQASQLLFDGGKTGLKNDIKTQAAYSSFYGYLRTANNVAFNTITTYLNVLMQQELKQIAFNSVLSHQELLKNIKTRMDNGKEGRSEYERALARLSSAQSRLLLRENSYKKAIYEMHKVLGRFLSVDDMQIPKLNKALMPKSLKDAFYTQTHYNPAIFEMYYNLDAKTSEYEALRKDYYGKLSLQASLSTQKEQKDNEKRDDEGKLFLHYENVLFDASRNDDIQKSKSLILAEQQKNYQVKRSLINDLQLSWSSYLLYDEQILVLKKNLYFTNRALKTYKQEFVIGKRNLINILDAQNEYQYAKEQLTEAMYSKEIEKYKILYSQGTLLRDLNLLTPQVKEIIKQDSKLETLSEDKLPLNTDFDKEGVEDKYDLSVNSLKNDEVDELGVSKSYNSRYIYDDLEKDVKKELKLINKQESLSKKVLKINVDTKFDYNVFIPKNTRLDTTLQESNMKDIVLQAKTKTMQSPFYVTVSTNEFDDSNKNYNLSMLRAYNFKQILTKHNIDPDSIYVFVDENAPKGENRLTLKFADEANDYKMQYNTNSINEKLFDDFSDKIRNISVLNELAKKIKNNALKVDIVLFANDFDNLQKNQEICQKRADNLVKFLQQKGIDSNKIVIYAWGSFKQDPLLKDKTSFNQKLSYVLRYE